MGRPGHPVRSSGHEISLPGPTTHPLLTPTFAPVTIPRSTPLGPVSVTTDPALPVSPLSFFYFTVTHKSTSTVESTYLTDVFRSLPLLSSCRGSKRIQIIKT